MQELVYTALVPHPPILIPDIGKAEVTRVRATDEAMRALASDLVAQTPDTVVIISPHGPIFRDAIAVHQLPSIQGDFGAFGAPQIRFQVPIDRELSDLVLAEGRRQNLPLAPVTEQWAAEWNAEKLDHGTMVPLYYLTEAGFSGPILPIAMGLLGPMELYQFGEILQKAIDQSGRRIAVLASGDLSHRLTPDAPAGYSPRGKEFDAHIVAALEKGDLAQVFQLDHDLCEEAGECGLRPLMILAGALDGMSVTPRVLSYEGPFGVGYAVVALKPGRPDQSRHLRHGLQAARRERIQQRRSQAHPIVRLARMALEHYIKTGLTIDFSFGAPHEGTIDQQLPADLPEQAGVFVSIKKDGGLRGCMGTTGPTEPILALETVRNAIMAGTEDPRFDAVEEEELGALDYSVDVLHPPEPCTLADLDPKRFGVIVEKGGRRGLLLPDLTGIDSVEEQVRVACQKAGLRGYDPGVALFRFRVDRYH